MKLIYSFIFLMLVVGLVCSNVKPPEVCVMPVGMTCSKFYLSTENKLNVSLVNGLQKTIVITNMSCTKNPSQFEACDSMRCDGYDANLGGVETLFGQERSFYISCDDENGNPMNLTEGDSYSGKISIEYYFVDEGPQNKRKIQGNIYVEVGYQPLQWWERPDFICAPILVVLGILFGLPYRKERNAFFQYAIGVIASLFFILFVLRLPLFATDFKMSIAALLGYLIVIGYFVNKQLKTTYKSSFAPYVYGACISIVFLMLYFILTMEPL